MTALAGATAHDALAAKYPRSTLKGSPACSNHNGTATYKTYVADQEESGCV